MTPPRSGIAAAGQRVSSLAIVPQDKTIVSSLLAWFSRNARDLPWRRTRDPYAIWIAEVMLQQTQVRAVLPFWERWRRELPTVAALAGASLDRVLKLWEGLGYYRRARNLHRAARQIVDQHRGRFPTEFREVLSLPGVGRYTAGAICSIAFNQPTPILDGNVRRVLTRLFAIRDRASARGDHAALWNIAQRLVEMAAARDAPALHRTPTNDLPNVGGRSCGRLNQALMELGALVCTPRRPQCPTCPLRRQCVARRMNLVHRLPRQPKRAETKQRQFMAFVLQRGSRFLVRQQPEGTINAGLWEFPNIEIGSRDTPAAAARRLFRQSPGRLRALGPIRHHVTRYRMLVEVFTGSPPSRDALELVRGQWRTLAELERLAFSRAHQRILKQWVPSCQAGRQINK